MFVCPDQASDNAKNEPVSQLYTPLPRGSQDNKGHRGGWVWQAERSLLVNFWLCRTDHVRLFVAGVFAKCRYAYYGKHSEGNRFICNDQLWIRKWWFSDLKVICRCVKNVPLYLLSFQVRQPSYNNRINPYSHNLSVLAWFFSCVVWVWPHISQQYKASCDSLDLHPVPYAGLHRRQEGDP